MSQRRFDGVDKKVQVGQSSHRKRSIREDSNNP
jgi:hypothetical protein